ncbi:TnsA-like heteromeric transposase endonuclease subunit [Streptomyces lavendulae]|uniref:TnsA-like heteromeric transposase endonuclease subunit n=1 Tax=Streptomyces lavendulae TaxID=1914 RepID=UPI0033ECA9EE
MRVVRYAERWQRVCERHHRWHLGADADHGMENFNLRESPEVAEAQRRWAGVERHARRAGVEPAEVFGLARAVVCRWWKHSLHWEQERIWPRRACEQAGWNYRRLAPLDAVLAANLRWLAGYRHPRNQIRPDLTAAVLAAFAHPRPLIDGVQAVGDPIEVLPAAFHALWHGHLSVPLERLLHERVLLQPGILPPSEAVRAANPHYKTGGRFREGP